MFSVWGKTCLRWIKHERQRKDVPVLQYSKCLFNLKVKHNINYNYFNLMVFLFRVFIFQRVEFSLRSLFLAKLFGLFHFRKKATHPALNNVNTNKIKSKSLSFGRVELNTFTLINPHFWRCLLASWIAVWCQNFSFLRKTMHQLLTLLCN